MGVALLLCAAVAVLLDVSPGFYLPDIGPNDYPTGERLEVMASKLTSPNNLLPYDYYSLAFCGSERAKELTSRTVHLGQLLVGERLKPTEYSFYMRQNRSCDLQCRKTFTKEEVRRFKKRISQDYAVRLSLDNMPVVRKGVTLGGHACFLSGYLIGEERDDKFYVNNHLEFRVLYNEPMYTGSTFNSLEFETAPEKSFRVVGFEVVPFSMMHSDTTTARLRLISCAPSVERPPQEIVAGLPILFTYSVDFVLSRRRWATRWDPLLALPLDWKEMQWYRIVDILMFSNMVTAFVGVVLMKTVLHDCMRFSQLDDEDEEEAEERTSWMRIRVCLQKLPSLTVS
jgi:transmembrane 9 superfamily member 2/4